VKIQSSSNQNYRFHETILEAANALIKHNVRRRGKKLWSSEGAGAKITLQKIRQRGGEARTVVEQIDYCAHGRRAPWSNAGDFCFAPNVQSRPLETALRHASVRFHLLARRVFFDRREVRDFLALSENLCQSGRRCQFVAELPTCRRAALS